jgi:high-affinity Fe2+/Pb2+ permease
MGSSERTAGHKPALFVRVKGVLLGAAAAGLLASGVYMLPDADAAARPGR